MLSLTHSWHTGSIPFLAITIYIPHCLYCPSSRLSCLSSFHCSHTSLIPACSQAVSGKAEAFTASQLVTGVRAMPHSQLHVTPGWLRVTGARSPQTLLSCFPMLLPGAVLAAASAELQYLLSHYLPSVLCCSHSFPPPQWQREVCISLSHYGNLL